MTTTSRRKYFRRNIGDPGDGTDSTVDVFSDEEIDDIYTEVEENIQTGTSESTVKIAAVVIGFEWLIADAVKQISYLQNDTRVEGQTLPKRLMEWHKVWSNKLDTALGGDFGPAFRSGVTKKIPLRRKEYPDA